MNPSYPQRPSDGLGQSVSRMFVGTLIPVMGLFVLRLVLVSLPMIKNAGPIADLGVTPLLLIKAALDTTIYFLIMRFAIGASQQIKLMRPHLLEIANIVMLAGCALVATLAYSGYEALFASLAPTQMEVYNWLFLAIVLIPIVLIVVIATRRLDLFTELMFGKISSAVAAPQPASQPAWNPPPPAPAALPPPPALQPVMDPAEQQIRGRMESVQQIVGSARQTAERLNARGGLQGDLAESFTKMESYLVGAVKSVDRGEWDKAKGFADWAEYEANRILTAAN